MSKLVKCSIIIVEYNAGNDPEAVALTFHHQGCTFINAYCQAAKPG